MCLGVPGKVLAIDGLVATVDFFGVTRKVRLDIIDADVHVGDYVLNHVGYAIRRIPDEEIEGTLSLFDQILRDAPPDDLARAEVEAEIEATRPGGAS